MRYPYRSHISVLLTGFFASALAGACATTASDDECPLGTEGCPCFEFTCDGGLICAGNICQPVSAESGDPSTSGDPTTTGDDTVTGDSTGSGESTTTGDPSTTTGDPGTTSGDPSTTSGDPSTTSGDPTTTSGDGDGDGDGDPPCDTLSPNGAVCAVDADCCSGSCYEVPVLSNLCGECKQDSECENGGCTVPSIFPGIEAGSFCNNGEAGAGCQTDAACQPGLTCELVLDLSTLGLVVNGCSECSTDNDCAPGEVCGVDAAIADTQQGQRLCQPIGSVANNDACTNSGTVGNLACASGFCGTVNVEGLLTLQVCGECLDDGDCPLGEVCQPGTFDLASLQVTGAVCGQP